MRRLEMAEHPVAELEVIECTCGYHMGIDATYVAQVGDFVAPCPSCGRVIDTDESKWLGLSEPPSKMNTKELREWKFNHPGNIFPQL